MKLFISLLLSLAAAFATTAAAQAWPSRPIRLIVPFPPGGSTDAVARLLGQRLGERLGQAVVVDNKPGAAGNLGTDVVAKAAADGYTLALSTSGPLANNQHLYPAMPFDPARDLTPVALVGEIPLVLAANPSLKVSRLKEFLALARSRPKGLAVAHPGNGTIGHLSLALLKAQSKVDLLAVPYKGDTPAINDLLGGSVDAVSAPLTAFIPLLQSGKLRGLAVTSRQRFAGLPEVPTALEQGLDVEASVWFAVVGPAGLAPAVVQRLNTEINAILALPEVKSRLAQFGATANPGSPQQLASKMNTDSARWKALIHSNHITID